MLRALGAADRAGAVPVVGAAAPAVREVHTEAARLLGAGLSGRTRRPAAAHRQPCRLRRALAPRPARGQPPRDRPAAPGVPDDVPQPLPGPPHALPGLL